MKIDKFTQKAQEAISEAQDIAVSEGHQQLDVEHLHLALMMQTDGLIPRLVKFMEVDSGRIIGDLENEMEKLSAIEFVKNYDVDREKAYLDIKKMLDKLMKIGLVSD